MAELWCVLMWSFFSLPCRMSRLLACRWLCSTFSLWCRTSSLTLPFFSNLLSTFFPKDNIDSPSVFWFRREHLGFNNLTFSLILFYFSIFYHLPVSLSGRKHVNNGLYRFRQGESVCVCVRSTDLLKSWCDVCSPEALILRPICLIATEINSQNVWWGSFEINQQDEF